MTSVFDKSPREALERIDVLRQRRAGNEFVINVRLVVGVMCTVVLVLIVTGTVANLITFHVAPSPDHRLARFMHRFDLGHEPSLPNLYSSFALLASSGLLAFISLVKSRFRDRDRNYWIGLAVLFLGLSIDEGVTIHEMLHMIIVERIEVHGVFHFPWVVPAFLFAIAVGLWYLPFLRRLDRRTTKLFLCAGGIYVGGAVGMEMFGGALADVFGESSIHHTFAQAIEELLEMLGIVIFIYALLDYIRRYIGVLQVSVL